MQSKIKILYIITKSNFGGAQRYVFELATNLPKDAYEVVVAFGGEGLLKQKLEKNGIQTHTIKSFERDIHLLKEVHSCIELNGLIRELKPDIVHLNSSKAGGSGSLIARFARVPLIVYTAHGWPFHERRNFFWRGMIWGLSYATALLAHKIILVSAIDAKHTYMPFTKRKSVVIPNALPRIDFLSHEASREILFSNETIEQHKNDLWLVTVAELTANKNLLTVVKAVAAYNAKNPAQRIFYTILGGGELFETLHSYIQEHGIENDIHLAGYVPDARIYLHAFDAFILPSYKEGMPYALLEAGSAGLPVIASKVGGIPEIITHKENGLLIDPVSQESIEKALEHIAQHADEAETYSLRLKEKVSSGFALETVLEKTIAQYTSK